MTKREALKNLRRDAQMVRAYQEREDDALITAREAGATMRELARAQGSLTTGGIAHRLAGLSRDGHTIPRGRIAS